jgi:hypothetical protein
MIDINNMGSLIAGFVIAQTDIDEYNIRYVVSTKLRSLFPNTELYDIDLAVTVALDHLALWRDFLGVIHDGKNTIQ